MAEPAPDVVIRAENAGKSFRIGSEAKKESVLGTTHRLLTGVGSSSLLWALRGIDLEVRRGETLGIVGPNGAGKSTLLLLLGRVLAPSEGRVTIAGQTDLFFGLEEGLQPKLTVRENMSLCAALLGMSRKTFERRQEAMLAFSELEKYLYAKFGELSSGLAARLAFSVAIHADLDIILVDEKLAVGDGAFQEKCVAVFRDFQKQGKTLLIVSHSLQLIDRLCPRTLYLNAGRPVFCGDTAHALTRFARDCGLPVPGAAPPRPAPPGSGTRQPAAAGPGQPSAGAGQPVGLAVPELLEKVRDAVRAELRQDRKERSAALARSLEEDAAQWSRRRDDFAERINEVLGPASKRVDDIVGGFLARLERFQTGWLQPGTEMDVQLERCTQALSGKIERAVAQLGEKVDRIRDRWLRLAAELPGTTAPGGGIRGGRRQLMEEAAAQALSSVLGHEGPLKFLATFENAFVYMMAQLTSPGAGLGFEPGDEIITTGANYPVVRHLPAFGLSHVALDLDPETLNMDPVQLGPALGPRSRAVLVSYLAGTCPPLETLKAFCEERRILLIENVWRGLGCRSGGRFLGTWGDISCCSPAWDQNLPEAWSVVMARPGLVRLFDRAPCIPKHTPFYSHEPLPATTAGLAACLEASWGFEAGRSRQAEISAYLRGVLSRFPQEATLPLIPPSFSADSETVTLMLREDGAVRRDNLREALHAAGVLARPAAVPFWPPAVGDGQPLVRQGHLGQQVRLVNALPHSRRLTDLGLDVCVDAHTVSVVRDVWERLVSAGTRPI